MEFREVRKHNRHESPHLPKSMRQQTRKTEVKAAWQRLRFGDVEENVTTREEWSLDKSRESLKDETIAVLGYGVPGARTGAQSEGQWIQRYRGAEERLAYVGTKPFRTGGSKARAFLRSKKRPRAERLSSISSPMPARSPNGTRWKPHLTAGKCLYFSHGFAVTFKDQTHVIPPDDIDVVLIAPKGSGTSLRRLFVAGKGLNSSYAVFQDATGRAMERGHISRHRRRFRLPLRDRFPQGSLFGFDRRARAY